MEKTFCRCNKKVGPVTIVLERQIYPFSGSEWLQCKRGE
jgi:hypothetical protein